MASADEIFPESERCEICGIVLGDEVVIQEFADGSLARLCPECAAGADLEGPADADHGRDRNPESVWPDEREPYRAIPAGEVDPLEKTRELLMPVTDLIALQGEMQTALERLAASLERFAAEMITDSQGKTAVENRLHMLEHELDATRTKLSETEFLLTAATAGGPGADALANTLPPLETPTVSAPASLPEVRPPSAGTAIAPTEEEPGTSVAAAPSTSDVPAVTPPAVEADTVAGGEAGVMAGSEDVVATGSEDGALADEEDRTMADAPVVPPVDESAGAPTGAPPAAVPAAPLVAPPVRPVAAGPDAEPPETPADDDQRSDRLPTFRIDEVQAAQRYYNESPFTGRIRDVRQSLGKPKANLTRLPGTEPHAIVTIAWDIVWYQYHVNMRRDLPSGVERVSLHREGMDLDELAFYFKEKNAVINDDGRLDASELEVKLLSDPDALITEMTSEEMRLLEDATEEIWDQRISPEFKWDD